MGIAALTYLYSRIKTMKKLTWFIFLSIIAISCLNEPDCYQLDNDEIILAFNVMEFGADEDSLIDIRISGTEDIFYTDTALSSVVLPLSPITEELKYIFRWQNGSIDTLVLGYSVQIQFVSEECAQRYVFTSLNPLSSTFDSVRLYNATPTYPESTNLVIYRCAKPNLAGVKFKTTDGTTESDYVLTVNNVEPDFASEAAVIQSAASFYLPLNKNANTTTFKFNMEGGEVENLSLSYTRTTRRSPIQDCDSVTFFSKIKIIATSFDTTSTKFINTASSTSTIESTSTQDPAIVNFEIFL